MEEFSDFLDSVRSADSDRYLLMKHQFLTELGLLVNKEADLQRERLKSASILLAGMYQKNNEWKDDTFIRKSVEITDRLIKELRIQAPQWPQ